MATFLALCQQVASDSGTIDGNSTLPTAVIGQTGRLAKIVRWTNQAWRSIQNAHGSWRWMQAEFSSGNVASGTRAYSGSDLGLTRHAEWAYSGRADENRFTLYPTADGVAQEGQLEFVDYRDFYTRFMRGPQTNARPTYFTINPENKIALHPIPDAAYTIRGIYRKTPQDLTANDDEPEMPARFHDLIVDAALVSLGIYDEAVAQIPLWRLRQIVRFSELETDQLPRITLAGALA